MGVLGPIILAKDGQQMSIQTRMLRDLLALLVSEPNSPLSMDFIADAYGMGLHHGRPARRSPYTFTGCEGSWTSKSGYPRSPLGT